MIRGRFPFTRRPTILMGIAAVPERVHLTAVYVASPSTSMTSPGLMVLWLSPLSWVAVRVGPTWIVAPSGSVSSVNARRLMARQLTLGLR